MPAKLWQLLTAAAGGEILHRPTTDRAREVEGARLPDADQLHSSLRLGRCPVLLVEDSHFFHTCQADEGPKPLGLTGTGEPVQTAHLSITFIYAVVYCVPSVADSHTSHTWRDPKRLCIYSPAVRPHRPSHDLFRPLKHTQPISEHNVKRCTGTCLGL